MHVVARRGGELSWYTKEMQHAACGGTAIPEADMLPKAKRFDSVRCMWQTGRAFIIGVA